MPLTKFNNPFHLILFLIVSFTMIVSCTTQKQTATERNAKYRTPGCDVIIDEARIEKRIIYTDTNITSGFYTANFLVDAPHYQSMHSVIFNKDYTFDYRILDEDEGIMDIYKGKWYDMQNDTLYIAIKSEWNTTHATVRNDASHDSIVISSNWQENSELSF